MTDSTKCAPESSTVTQLNKFARDISTFSHNATEEEREALLRLLSDGQVLELLEPWRSSDRRSGPRRPCFLTVQFAVGEQVLAEIVKNASTTGVLMHTFAPLSVGQEITMTIWPANLKEPVEATGEIVWTGKDGVGVRFKTPPNKNLEDVIESF